MSERDLPLLLQDIKVAIESILDYTKGYNVEIYEQEVKTRHAVERNFEIIGEAATKIPNQYKELYPQIE